MSPPSPPPSPCLQPGARSAPRDHRRVGLRAGEARGRRGGGNRRRKDGCVRRSGGEPQSPAMPPPPPARAALTGAGAGGGPPPPPAPPRVPHAPHFRLPPARHSRRAHFRGRDPTSYVTSLAPPTHGPAPLTPSLPGPEPSRCPPVHLRAPRGALGVPQRSVRSLRGLHEPRTEPWSASGSSSSSSACSVGFPRGLHAPPRAP